MEEDSQDKEPMEMDEAAKDRALEPFRESPEGTHLTTNQGLKIQHTDDSLKAGPRGPTLMEDFHFREKMTHFDHERIPERIVHARGSAAHGYFQVYESLAPYTKAKFLQDPSVKTPVFVRFSTVVGFRGSADTVRDARGFAVKFYTEEGNYDIVGNNIPVFFIQDAIKFPDLVHAIKPEPHNEMPQASSAHDTFWDFISLMPESTAMIMWVLSDRAIPRSLRMMEGFGVHTFRFVNEAGKAHFVKFHWKPVLGMCSLVWDEAQKLAGKDADFHRRDLWEAIEQGDYPEFELGVQLVPEEDELKFDFDLLDPTKLIPEEEVPVRIIGKLTLNRNPDNFFAETEQAAFHPGHVVPGIDFSNDPLLQGRLFSYTDTQLIRLGGPNFAEIPINRPVVPVHNNQRDGYMRQTINKSRTSYFPNLLADNHPRMASEAEGGYVHHAEKVEGHKIRARSESFGDHFSQATLFWNSLSATEQDHLVEAATFELGKVTTKAIRERMVERFSHVDQTLASRVAARLGLPEPATVGSNHGRTSPALSMENTVKDTIRSRRIALLVAEGFDFASLNVVKAALEGAGAHTEVVAPIGGMVKSASGQEVEAKQLFLTTASIMYDAVYIPGGAQSVATLRGMAEALHFVNEAFKHFKPIAAFGEGIQLLEASYVRGFTFANDASSIQSEQGVVTGATGSNPAALVQAFIPAIAQHRHWGRTVKVPA